MQQRGTFEATHGGLFTYGAFDTKNCGQTPVHRSLADQNLSPISWLKLLEPLCKSSYNATEELYRKTGKVTPPTLDFTIRMKKFPLTLFTTLLSFAYLLAYSNVFVQNFVVKTFLYLFLAQSKKMERSKCYFAIFPKEFAGFGPEWAFGRTIHPPILQHLRHRTKANRIRTVTSKTDNH
uniref:Uncharacterized protein n=1 Tax=Angiostrongylus cantonensis TaxID=6313 RepID=A0A0K0DJT3_ANGCA